MAVHRHGIWQWCAKMAVDRHGIGGGPPKSGGPPPQNFAVVRQSGSRSPRQLGVVRQKVAVHCHRIGGERQIGSLSTTSTLKLRLAVDCQTQKFTKKSFGS